jgi:hypothetical protein
MLREDIGWVIDGNEIISGPYSPDYEMDWYDVRLSAGLEYGFVVGRNGIMCTVDYEHGIHDIVDNPAGRAMTRLFTLGLGYRRFL